MTASGLVLGVDAGGTKTDVMLVDAEGGVAASVRAGGANHEALGWQGAATTLRAALTQGLAAAGAEKGDVVASAWGLAGLDWPADERAYRSIVDSLGLDGPAAVGNDAFLVLEVSPTPVVGVAVVSGTGMVVVGRADDGRTQRTLGVAAGRGSWGSGRHVVDAAVEAVAAQHLELGPVTALTEQALRAADVVSVEDYFHEVWRGGRTHLLPRDVWEVAAGGDSAAAGIADRVADSLAAGAAAVAHRLALTAPDVALAGRVLDPGHPVLHDRLVDALAVQLPDGRPSRLGVPPVVGASLAAARLARWGVDGWPLLATGRQGRGCGRPRARGRPGSAHGRLGPGRPPPRQT